MANAVQSAQELVKDEMIVVNPGDVFEKSAYAAVLEAQKDGAASSYILGARVKEYFPGGYLVVDDEKEILHIVEKPKRGHEPTNVVNIVVHLHRDAKALFRCLAKVKGGSFDAYEQALAGMMMRTGIAFVSAVVLRRRQTSNRSGSEIRGTRTTVSGCFSAASRTAWSAFVASITVWFCASRRPRRCRRSAPWRHTRRIRPRSSDTGCKRRSSSTGARPPSPSRHDR